MNKMNYIKILIVISLVIIGILLLLLVIKKDDISDDESYFGESEKVLEKNTNGFQIIDDSNIFYSVMNCISKYMNAINYEEDKELSIEENIFNIKNEAEKKEIIYSLLDRKFIYANNIEKENIENFISEIKSSKIIPIEMKVNYHNNDIQVYICHVYLEDKSEKRLKEKYFIVKVDTRTQAFSIEHVIKDYNSIDEIELNNTVEDIELNEYNHFLIETISSEALIKIYMNSWIEMVVQYPKIAYDKYLDNEYKKLRFQDFDNFKKYIEKNKTEIISVIPIKYKVENENGIEKYICLDQYNRVYEFNQTSIMNYKVQLDTYTIPTEKFKTEYNSSNDQNKIMLNVDKWIQMLNNRDYSAAYKVLDETFRNNNFGSEEKFEQYMREKFPLHYKLEFGEYSNEADIGMQKIILRDITGEDLEIIENTIIMQLKDDYDFVMSFEIK